MPQQTKAAIHSLIQQVFRDACTSATPLSTIAQWCVRLQESQEWSAEDIDLVADTTMRLLALQHRTAGQSFGLDARESGHA